MRVHASWSMVVCSVALCAHPRGVQEDLRSRERRVSSFVAWFAVPTGCRCVTCMCVTRMFNCSALPLRAGYLSVGQAGIQVGNLLPARDWCEYCIVRYVCVLWGECVAYGDSMRKYAGFGRKVAKAA